MRRTRFAILSSDGSAARWLDAVRQCPAAEVAAVSDRDARAASQWADQFGVTVIDDPRQMLMQSMADVLIAAVSPAGSEKLLPVAAERGMGLLLETPPARSAEEAANIVRLFDTVHRPVLVASGWRVQETAADAPWREERIGRVVQAVAQVEASWPVPLGWRGDRVRAGGGVLLIDAYDAVDMLVNAMGLPSDVTAQAARLGPPGAEPYDNEDTASVLLRFGDGRSATVAARWGGRDGLATLRVIGTNESLDIAIESRDAAARRALLISRMCEEPNGKDAAHDTVASASLREHLATLAVIESCYLSARTKAAETPHLPFERAAAILR